MQPKFGTVIGVIALAGLLTACQEPPQVEVDATRTSVTSAEEATKGGRYAQEELAKARADMQAVDAELQVQADKFALFRSYEHTNELIAQAKASAEAARTAAVEAETQAKADAESARDAVKAQLTEAQTLVASLGECPRQPKGFKADIEALQGKLDGLTAQSAGIDQAIASEDYQGASTQAQSLGEQITLLTTDVTTAKEKINCP